MSFEMNVMYSSLFDAVFADSFFSPMRTVYVVSDTKNPQNEGKVFLYKFGKKIFDKVNDLMNPEFEDETPVILLIFGKVRTSN